MGDDLLITNKYVYEDDNDASDRLIYEKLDKSKDQAKELYDEDAPEFTEKINIDTNTGVSVSEKSVAYEQFIKFSEIDKRKKIKRTVVNIDSKNRQKQYNLDRQSLRYTGTPLIFTKNSDVIKVRLGRYNFVSKMNTNTELILENLDSGDFVKIGIDKSYFEFNINSGFPIFTVTRFIDSNTNKVNIDTFDESTQEYKFNELEVKIPNNIDISEINTFETGSGCNINLISNLKIGYPSSSHYKISLGTSFSNVYSVRLISSEIPNTAYTFNENKVETNFGKFKLETQINNKLRWVNKSDAINIINKNINTTSKIFSEMPNIITSDQPMDIHNNNFQKISQQTTLQVGDVNYELNLRRINTLARLSLTDKSLYNQNLPIETRDYYVNPQFVGDFSYSQSGDSISGLVQNVNTNMDNIVNFFNENLVYKMSNDLDSFRYFFANQASLYGDVTLTIDNGSDGIKINVNGDITNISSLFQDDHFPYKIVLNSLDTTNIVKGIFSVYKKVILNTNSLVLYAVPMQSYNNSTDYNNGVLVTVCNYLSNKYVTNLDKYHSEVYDMLKRYYLRTDICLVPYDDVWDSLSITVPQTDILPKNVKTLETEHNIANHIVRIYKNNDKFSYVEYFVGSRLQDNTYEVRYKSDNGNFSFNGETNYLKIFKESHKIYFRETIGNYLVTKIENNTTSNIFNAIEVESNTPGDYAITLGTIGLGAIIRNFENNLDTENLLSDMVDITDFDIVSIHNRDTKTGIQEISFAKEYISEEEISIIDNIDLKPKINATSNKIPGNITLSTDSDKYDIDDLKEVEKHPVYELNIPSGKYSADSIIKFMTNILSNIKSRSYDYSKGIFRDEIDIHKYIDLNNENDINNECKFVLSINKSVSLITMKQYKKIFDSHKNPSVDKRRVLFYNEGFPYIYFRIPSISVPRNSLIYINGFSSIDNIRGGSLNKEKRVIKPRSYKICVRQILPLPKKDFLNNKENLYTREGYIDTPDTELYNKYIDYINSAISDSNVRDFSPDYIADRIFNVGESDYFNDNKIGLDKLNNMQGEYQNINTESNTGTFYNGDLSRSYIDNHGNNVQYKNVEGYANENVSVVANSNTGIEYAGQPLINGFNNDTPHYEYDNVDRDRELYPDSNKFSGVESLFFKNELLMKLSDINETNKKNTIGRITHISNAIDSYGNVDITYDLFSDNHKNFSIGDIVIGLDSDTIGIILPYDYDFNRLPNIDMISLGIGAYLLNRSVESSRIFFDKYLVISDRKSEITRDLVKGFIGNMRKWQIEENKTSAGFYVYSKTVPSRSRIEGMMINNLQIYEPYFFKFLEDEDTALSKFGFVNKYYNNKWDYFKNNYDVNNQSEIKRSFFNIGKNNDIYDDYLIVETKSSNDFNINDKVFIENHKIIHKNSDFRKERFFNIELLESLGGFITKMEKLYNTTVLNHNSKSSMGIIDSVESDNIHLKDTQYCGYENPDNNTAKVICEINASVNTLSIVNPGFGYVGLPKIKISDSSQTNALICVNKNIEGRLSDISVVNSGSGYKNTPEIIIDQPSEDATGSAVLNSYGHVTDIDLVGTVNGVKLSKGMGYTKAPTISIGQSGTRALGVPIIDGIGTIDVKTGQTIDDLDVNEIEYLDIRVEGDATGITNAKAYILREDRHLVDGDYFPKGKFLGVVVSESGKGYSQSDIIDVVHIRRKRNGDNFINNSGQQNASIEDDTKFIARIDAIGTITVTEQGSGYVSTNPPKATILRTGDSVLGRDAICTVVVNSNSELDIDRTVTTYGGSGYKSATLVFDPPGAIAEAKLNIGITDYTINNNGDYGYSNPSIKLNQKALYGLYPGIYYKDSLIIQENTSITASILQTTEITNMNDILLVNFNDKETVFSFSLTESTTLSIVQGNSTRNLASTISISTIKITELLEPVVSNGSIEKVNIISSGTFTDTIDILDISEENASSTASIQLHLGNTGYIKECEVLYSGTEYVNIPEVSISKPKIDATIEISTLNNMINDISIVERGTGYTKPPKIDYYPYDFLHKNGEPEITSSIGNGNIESLSFQNPTDAVVEKNIMNTTGVTIGLDSNRMYFDDNVTISENIKFGYGTPGMDATFGLRFYIDPIQYNGTQNSLIVDSDIPGGSTIEIHSYIINEIVVQDISKGGFIRDLGSISGGFLNKNLIPKINNGNLAITHKNILGAHSSSGSLNNPEIDVTNTLPISQATVSLGIIGNIESINLYEKGRGYTTIPNIQIESTGLIVQPTISLCLETIPLSNLQQVSSIDLINGGSNFTSIPYINIDKPSIDTLQTIPFKNKYIFRNFHYNYSEYDKRYYATLSDVANDSSKFVITLSNDSIILNTLEIGSVNILNMDNSDNLEYICIEDNSLNQDLYIKSILNNQYVLNKESASISLVMGEKYFIKKSVYRLPIAVKKLGSFVDNIYNQVIDNSKYIDKYDTLGIFERIVDEQMNHIDRNISYNIVKGSELYRKYSYNMFRNRIVKLKVCSIDDKGFCYENVPTEYQDSGYKASYSNVSQRMIKGYCKKLFPYHEYDIIQTYHRSENGTTVDVTGISYKNYTRTKQALNNKSYSSKQFLPGMGIYAIKETSKSGVQYSNKHYNVLSSTINIPLVYSEYSYTSDFIGYVLGVSLKSEEEYNKECRLNSESFSKTSNQDSVHNEYYIYALIDPEKQNKEDIDDLFNVLNKDNINIVFDASADVDHTIDPIESRGYLSSKNQYYTDSTKKQINDSYSNEFVTRTGDKIYNIPKNTYGNVSYVDPSDNIVLYESENFDNIISATSVSPDVNGNTHDMEFVNYDGLTNLLASAIRINKPKLNKALKNYEFQKRIACATLIERPVCYEKRENTNSNKYFLSGEYDYFYKDYLENKSVIHYKTDIDKATYDNLNKTNTIIHNAKNTNTKQNNKESNKHALNLDSNNIKLDNEYIKYDVMEFDNLDSNNNIISMESGDDICIVNGIKYKSRYANGSDYGNIISRDSNTIGVDDVPIKVLSGSLLPRISFDYSNRFYGYFNKLMENTSLINLEYNSEFEKLTNTNLLGKYKTKRIDILGNNSIEYNQDNEKDVEDYNKVRIESVMDNTIVISTIYGPLTNVTDCIIVISSSIKSKNEILPMESPDITEMGIIKSIDNTEGLCTIELYDTLRLNTHSTDDKLQFAFILYKTVKITQDMTVTTGNTVHLNSVDNIEKGDLLLFDWGKKRRISKNRYPPHNVVSDNTIDEIHTTASYRVIETPVGNTVKIDNPYIYYPEGTYIIILKNPMQNTSKLSHTLLSTQPFTLHNKWYTKVMYRGSNINSGYHRNNRFRGKHAYNNVSLSDFKGGDSLFKQSFSGRVFIAGMKGISIPFVDINSISNNPDFIVKPIDDGYYNAISVQSSDHMIDANTKPHIHTVSGEFVKTIDVINKPDNIKNMQSLDTYNWVETKEIDVEYPYIIIEGFYLGYGGFIEERYNEDLIDTIVNNDKYFPIKKITKVDNKQYIYLQLNNIYNGFFNESNIDDSLSNKNQSSRNNFLDYEINLQFLDNVFKNKELSEYQNNISIFGKNGRIITRKMVSPYDLNPDNYIYLAIPTLSHIKSIQNSQVNDTFAKIILPGDSNRTLYNSFIAGTKIFYNNLFNNLSELEITFITNSGYLFDFNGSDHSLTLEITEIIDKFEYINPRYGNIEI